MSGERAKTEPLPQDWTLGVGRLGNPMPERSDEPKSFVKIRTVIERQFPDHYLTAEEAVTVRAKRLKENGIKHVRDGMTLRFEDGHGEQVVLTYSESPSPAGAGLPGEQETQR